MTDDELDVLLRATGEYLEPSLGRIGKRKSWRAGTCLFCSRPSAPGSPICAEGPNCKRNLELRQQAIAAGRWSEDR
jgi:hypothetical protein